MLKVNDKEPAQRQWCPPVHVFSVPLEHISYLFLVLPLSRSMFARLEVFLYIT